jgi:hypothetical protein
VSAENKVHKMDSLEPDGESKYWWDKPVEGEREDVDERINETGNQPIPQVAKPEPKEVKWTDDDPPPIEAKFEPKSKPKKLLLAQPEEQGECRGKAASNELGEGADEVDWIVDECPKEVEPMQEPARRRIVKFPKEGTTRSQIPIREQRGDPKSNLEEEDDAKSNPHIQIHT